jgi:hypothetical protein
VVRAVVETVADVVAIYFCSILLLYKTAAEEHETILRRCQPFGRRSSHKKISQTDVYYSISDNAFHGSAGREQRGKHQCLGILLGGFSLGCFGFGGLSLRGLGLGGIGFGGFNLGGGIVFTMSRQRPRFIQPGLFCLWPFSDCRSALGAAMHNAL